MHKMFIYPIYLDEQFDLNQLINSYGLQSFTLFFFIYFMNMLCSKIQRQKCHTIPSSLQSKKVCNVNLIINSKFRLVFILLAISVRVV